MEKISEALQTKRLVEKNDIKRKLENIKKGIKHKAEANKSRKRKIKRNVRVAERDAVEWPCPVTYALYKITQITVCGSKRHELRIWALYK